MADFTPLPSGYILEQKKRMSESLLWQLQRSAYSQFGIEAWTKKGVPFYMTSNPLTAKKYAQVVLGYIRDCLAPNASTPLDLSHPLNILDLGAGSGRFGYLFLKEIIPMLKQLQLGISIRYIMTDIVQENITFWQGHPYLETYIKEGILDFAFYHHADKDKPLHLIHNKQILSKDTLHNPLILLANYFFDTIPQDLFRIEDGKLQEGRVTLSVGGELEGETINPTDPSLIRRFRCDYDYFPLKDPKNYYPDQPVLNKILETYSQQFNNTPFLFPIGAFQSLEYFSNMSRNRLLLVAGDQGYTTEKQILAAGEPTIDRHGTFSIPVNYHALSLYFQGRNGVGMLTTFSEPIFVVITAILGASLKGYRETHFAFQEHLDAFEPKDYWKMVACLEKEKIVPSIECLLIILKLGNWDPMNFHAFFEMIRNHLKTASQTLKDQVQETIRNVWDKFYPMTVEEGDFILNLGVLFYEMQNYTEALLFFQRSLDITGDKAQTLINMGACHLALEDKESAAKCLQKAKTLKN